MTRYSNPLPPNQVPNSQGRPAGSGQQPAHTPYPETDHTGWPQARTARPAVSGYGDPAGFAPDLQTGGHAATQHDPYAALRPDGYGYSQPQPAADHYALSGYTAPQAPAAQAYGSRAPQQAPAQHQPAYGADGGYAGAGHQHLGGGHAHSPFATQAASAVQPQAYGAPQDTYGQPAAAPQPYGGYGAQPSTHNPAADQWGAQSLAVDARDFGHGYADAGHGAHGLGAQGHGLQGHGAQGQWGVDHYDEVQLDPNLGAGAYQNGEQAQHASFDQSYAEDDAQYEDEPRRGSWKKVAMLMACTVVVGGALTFAYSSIMGSGSGEPTPVVKGASGPSKVKPSEPGGKQFAHADSKVMGRLAEGGAEEADKSGVRKVPVVTVGRDGSIQAPSPTPPQEETRAVVAVPGLTVIDGLGGGAPSPNRPVAPKQQAQQQASPPVQMVTTTEANPVVVVPPKKQKTPSNLVGNAAPSETGTVRQAKADAAEIPPVAPPKKQKVAAVDTAPVATGPKPTGAGYVAVLASVPASGSSRIDALKQFADMQQKYGVILQNKTPDIREANLGEKGTYHRLLVGPPGSRDSANSVCTQLKAEGYSGCWVTAY